MPLWHLLHKTSVKLLKDVNDIQSLKISCNLNAPPLVPH